MLTEVVQGRKLSYSEYERREPEGADPRAAYSTEGPGRAVYSIPPGVCSHTGYAPMPASPGPMPAAPSLRPNGSGEQPAPSFAQAASIAAKAFGSVDWIAALARLVRMIAACCVALVQRLRALFAGASGKEGEDGDGEGDGGSQKSNGTEEDGALATEKRLLNVQHYRDGAANFNAYEPDQWLPTLSLNVTDFMRWPWLLITAWGVLLQCYVEWINPDILYLFSLSSDAHTILGGALSFLIVFRTNSSYDRWWEARCAWQTVITTCRSLAAQTAPALRNDAATDRLIMQLAAFTVSLKCFLREEPITENELGDAMDRSHIELLNASRSPCILSLRLICSHIRQNLPLDDPSTVFDESTLGTTIYNEAQELVRMLSICVGQCERIKNTPMTFGYVATLRSFLILWMVTLPICTVGAYGWLAPPALSFLAYVFFNIEQMAIEIEQPFGDDDNDLPLEAFILDLEETMLEMIELNEEDLMPPCDDAGRREPPPPKPGRDSPAPPSKRGERPASKRNSRRCARAARMRPTAPGRTAAAPHAAACARAQGRARRRDGVPRPGRGGAGARARRAAGGPLVALRLAPGCARQPWAPLHPALRTLAAASTVGAR